jgi:hypothetical protein
MFCGHARAFSVFLAGKFNPFAIALHGERCAATNSTLAGETVEARAALQTLLKLSSHVFQTWIEDTSVWTTRR